MKKPTSYFLRKIDPLTDEPLWLADGCMGHHWQPNPIRADSQAWTEQKGPPLKYRSTHGSWVEVFIRSYGEQSNIDVIDADTGRLVFTMKPSWLNKQRLRLRGMGRLLTILGLK